MAIKIDRVLLTSTWTVQVDALQSALETANIPDEACQGCITTLYEMAEDGLLHVTITKPWVTMLVTGWIGPILRTDGRIDYTRTFIVESTSEMMRHIRDMLSAPKL